MYAVFIFPAILWLLSVAAGLLAFRFGISSRAQPLWAALSWCLLALTLSYFGLTRFHATASRSVNGSLQWRIDSRWFFIASLILGAAALTLTLWNRRKAANQATGGAPPALNN